jgi:predicted nucleic acid-binding protein
LRGAPPPRSAAFRALEVYERDRLDFADAYLVAQAEASSVAEILSFDRSIDRVESVTPPRTLTDDSLATKASASCDRRG